MHWQLFLIGTCSFARVQRKVFDYVKTNLFLCVGLASLLFVPCGCKRVAPPEMSKTRIEIDGTPGTEFRGYYVTDDGHMTSLTGAVPFVMGSTSFGKQSVAKLDAELVSTSGVLRLTIAENGKLVFSSDTSGSPTNHIVYVK
jgi:hypothetical protein